MSKFKQIFPYNWKSAALVLLAPMAMNFMCQKNPNENRDFPSSWKPQPKEPVVQTHLDTLHRTARSRINSVHGGEPYLKDIWDSGFSVAQRELNLQGSLSMRDTCLVANTVLYKHEGDVGIFHIRYFTERNVNNAIVANKNYMDYWQLREYAKTAAGITIDNTIDRWSWVTGLRFDKIHEWLAINKLNGIAFTNWVNTEFQKKRQEFIDAQLSAPKDDRDVPMIGTYRMSDCTGLKRYDAPFPLWYEVKSKERTSA